MAFAGGVRQPPLARRAEQRIDDAVVLEQILGPFRRTALRKVRGRCAHHLPARRNAARDEIGILQATDADRDVIALIDEVDLPIVVNEFDRHSGIAIEKPRDGRSQMQDAEGHRRRDSQRAARLRLKARDLELSVFDFFERADAAPIQLRTCFGETQAAGRAIQQARAEFLLQPGDSLAHDWLRRFERLRRRGEARQFDDLDEDGDVGEVLHGLQANWSTGRLVDWPDSARARVALYSHLASAQLASSPV